MTSRYFVLVLYLSLLGEFAWSTAKSGCENYDVIATVPPVMLNDRKPRFHDIRHAKYVVKRLLMTSDQAAVLGGIYFDG